MTSPLWWSSLCTPKAAAAAEAGAPALPWAPACSPSWMLCRALVYFKLVQQRQQQKKRGGAVLSRHVC